MILGRNPIEAPSLTHHEEGHGGSSMDRAVLNVGLVRQVIGGLDGRFHPLDGEKCCQVGRVRGDNDERERPPAEQEEEGFNLHVSRSSLRINMPPFFPLHLAGGRQMEGAAGNIRSFKVKSIDPNMKLGSSTEQISLLQRN